MQAAVDNRSPGAVEAAKKFLSETLANGAVETKQIDEAATASMIAERTLRRAYEALKVQSAKEKGKRNGAFFWRLPRQGAPLAMGNHNKRRNRTSNFIEPQGRKSELLKLILLAATGATSLAP